MNFAETVKQLEQGKPVYKDGKRFKLEDGEIWKDSRLVISLDDFVEQYLGDEFEESEQD